MEIRRLDEGDEKSLFSMTPPFDHPPVPEASRKFFHQDGHHILVAYEDRVAAGFVTGVELTHPDKGTEMFLYELGVREDFQRRGIGKALVSSLRDLALERGCYGMWVLTDPDNHAAMATYRSSGALEAEQTTMLTWKF